LPHDEAEDAKVYPIVASIREALTRQRPWRAPISTFHIWSIFWVEPSVTCRPRAPDAEDSRGFKRILYGLFAIRSVESHDKGIAVGTGLRSSEYPRALSSFFKY
jgi:hypothetical protein